MTKIQSERPPAPPASSNGSSVRLRSNQSASIILQGSAFKVPHSWISQLSAELRPSSTPSPPSRFSAPPVPLSSGFLSITISTPLEVSPILEKVYQSPETTGVNDLPSGAEGLEGSDGNSESDAQSREDREVEHRRMWEAGQVDYLGRDAFQNIQKMLDRFLDPHNETLLP
ncbi:hypothetical protein CRENBAI_024682 [Crenichthys baileyi]|uniref:Glycogenin 2 n=1 Tax=Crenichthys baileyi TaxID=28760 RepID=A0AAV9RPN6_9TELE